MVYLGEPVGLVFEVENGTKLYFAGDTNVFGDMQLIKRLYAPDVAILPIGGHFTMDPREAAVALEFLGAKQCVPCHYGTFPILAGTPDELRAARALGCRDPLAGARGDDRGLRQRWFGATRQQVPQLALEGEIEFPSEPLVARGARRRAAAQGPRRGDSRRRPCRHARRKCWRHWHDPK